MNPWYGDIDPYAMAAASIDEAIRNCVVVGADPEHIGILDNFCWGYTDRPETLGTLVRAALACRDTSIAFGTPFISGKDSLNNEFSYVDAQGQKQTISIPSTLLISALGLVPQAEQCVSMDLKQTGNVLVMVGVTGEHLGGAHALWQHPERTLGQPPEVNVPRAKELYRQLHRAIRRGLVRSAHDLSEGGLAVAASEMSFAGGLGIEIDLGLIPVESGTKLSPQVALFSESSSRILCELEPSQVAEFLKMFPAGTAAAIGSVTGTSDVVFRDQSAVILQSSWQSLKNAWQSPLDWK
jgi:phosphoribosylformylglycinamidine synthase